MSDERRALFEIDGRLPKLGYSFPLALQHLVAMIVGCVTPDIIISSVAGLDGAGSILLIQSSLVCAALSTLLQLFGIKGICGARLPVIMGVSFAYLATMGDIAGRFGLAEIFGAQLVGGLVAIVIGVYAKRLQKLFPPLITGTVVFTIGLSLYPTAITYMAGGSGNPMFGSWQNWLVAIFTLVVVTCSEKAVGQVLSLVERHPEGITLSTDSNGSFPKWNQAKEIVGMDRGRISTLDETVSSLISQGLERGLAYSLVTSSPARWMRLAGKGRIGVGYDADIVIRDGQKVRYVISRGQVLVREGRVKSPMYS